MPVTQRRKAAQPGLPVKIVRRAPIIPLARFTDFFKEFEGVQAVRSVFGDETNEVLGKLKVAFLSSRHMYMGVRLPGAPATQFAMSEPPPSRGRTERLTQGQSHGSREHRPVIAEWRDESRCRLTLRSSEL